MQAADLMQGVPAVLSEEWFQTLVHGKGMRIERIVSKGHCSSPGFWYEQEESEWILLVKGAARLRFAEPECEVELRPGMHVNIAAHERHRVEWTVPDEETVWLAVFYEAADT